ncbi:MAG: LuxR C-terminal-related transcriptional regulator [Chloroflexi bacterium]|nr:LuxR C-terminal-related transcriptional regulator [Chloroflexota bacterium]
MGTNNSLDNSSLLLVGVITYNEIEDRHTLRMTRSWEQRLSRGRILDVIEPDSSDRHILELLAQGAGSKQIARALSSNSDSAGRRIRKVLDRLGVESRAEAVALATRLKWIRP